MDNGQKQVVGTHDVQKPKILILSVSHGAGHQRAADALRKALQEIQSDAVVDVLDALAYCTRWFRNYYNSYHIPLRYCPALWGWIEKVQHDHPSTGPRWLYRRGGEPLFQFIQAYGPDIVIATEVGMCELAALLKREAHARFHLVGICLMNVYRAWAKPEVDLYPVAPGDLAAQLKATGVPPAKILPCGTPIDPSFAVPRNRTTARTRLGVESDFPLLLILFGGTGFGKPRRILAELNKVKQPLEVVFITGRNQRLEQDVYHLCRGRLRTRVFGWVDNMHEWMAAADLLVSKPAGVTVFEAITSGLPLLAFDPLPGDENRNCHLVQQWQVGVWVKHPADLASTVDRLLTNREELQLLRKRALELARPHAARDAAEAILKLVD